MAPRQAKPLAVPSVRLQRQSLLVIVCLVPLLTVSNAFYRKGDPDCVRKSRLLSSLLLDVYGNHPPSLNSTIRAVFSSRALAEEITTKSLSATDDWQLKFLLPFLGQEEETGQVLVAMRLHVPSADMTLGDCKMAVVIGEQKHEHVELHTVEQEPSSSSQNYQTYEVKMQTEEWQKHAKSSVDVQMSCRAISTVFFSSDSKEEDKRCRQRCSLLLPRLQRTFLALHFQRSKALSWSDVAGTRWLNKRFRALRSAETNQELNSPEKLLQHDNPERSTVSEETGENPSPTTASSTKQQTLGAQGDKQRHTMAVNHRSCMRTSLLLNFSDLALDYMFLSPPLLDIGRCSGSCYGHLADLNLQDDNWENFHSIHEGNHHNLLHQLAAYADSYERREIKLVQQCCRATYYEPQLMTLGYIDRNQQAVAEFLFIPEMVIKKCNCQ